MRPLKPERQPMHVSIPGSGTRISSSPWPMACCFRKGEEYAHGGLSLQECLTLELTITQGTGSSPVVAAAFTDVVWKGLRCTVAVDGHAAGLSLDVRTQPGNASSSIVVSVKPLKKNGTASVVVENEDLEGQAAAVLEGYLVRKDLVRTLAVNFRCRPMW